MGASGSGSHVLARRNREVSCDVRVCSVFSIEVRARAGRLPDRGGFARAGQSSQGASVRWGYPGVERRTARGRRACGPICEIVAARSSAKGIMVGGFRASRRAVRKACRLGSTPCTKPRMQGPPWPVRPPAASAVSIQTKKPLLHAHDATPTHFCAIMRRLRTRGDSGYRDRRERPTDRRGTFGLRSVRNSCRRPSDPSGPRVELRGRIQPHAPV